jgi:hypothetical protein
LCRNTRTSEDQKKHSPNEKYYRRHGGTY